ncbi:ABC transporter sulfonate/nitrate transport system substrate-binding protein [Alcanivorax xiamenensis]|uniref:ABC transporter sulfonate/nitrate transport system substrate-binding protein n=1 Tax=Alcanivorax xiamenensis TaxID=1177156 RepID=A0ABQ6Y821_9GAMM|nr:MULTISPECIES: ABC transporter substrate-binding protein [Alcanivorax]KAF0805705.1 ABC transporter sulfonate/nitrate transport system substrate-binding protein [Alcanivorax xiamenensis]
MNHKRYGVAACFSVFIGLASTPLLAETIRIGIGHQSMVTNTVSGGVVLEKLNLIEKHLPKSGKYQDADYDIVFKDYDSGPPITNQMLAGKLDFGVMGDYPLIVNGAKFQEGGRAETRFIAITGYNKEGTGNGIVVPVDSPVQSLSDLSGKAISTPVGSAAWGMTLKALRDEGLIDKVTIVNQSPPVGAANIAAGKIDAHADFCPWSEIMEFRGTGRKIHDGRQAGVPTFHGIVVRESYARDYPEVVQAVLQATLEAQQWIRDDPVRAAEQVAEWTGVEKEVLYLYFSNGGITTMDASVKPAWIAAMKYDHELLQKEKQIPDLNFNAWVDDSYLRNAYAASGLDYDKAVAAMVTPIPDNPALQPAEIWYAEDGVKGYDSIDAMLAAEREAEQNGSGINASYVYDKNSGLKLFGKSAFYARNGDQLAAFMRRPEAEAFAADGEVFSYRQILQSRKDNAVAER